ncbi:MAG: D-alanyl-D-alanine carboxypeptidase [Candidatus Sungbacteria bacterium]|nr:D-alanyl-D-alanine carboxypeptidase [Candidatus Sungbacteria bacterium]
MERKWFLNPTALITLIFLAIFVSYLRIRSDDPDFAFGAPSPYGAKFLDALTLSGGVISPALSAEAALSVFVDGEGRTKVLFERNASKKMPIASIAKLMTALVVSEYLSQDKEIIISRAAIDEPEEAGQFRPGEVFLAGDLLYSLLVESSNDAAAALAETIGREKFVSLMNAEAENIGLGDTYFANPTGLDESDFAGPTGYSTASDLFKLARFLTENRRRILEISSLPAYDLYDARGRLHHTLESTNELLRRRSWPVKVLGGKTGETPLAKQALILVTESPINRGYLVSVALGSGDRFGDIKALVTWVFNSYSWY